MPGAQAGSAPNRPRPGANVFEVLLAIAMCLAVGIVIWTAVEIERHLL
jgi:hypothetical protein